MKPLIAKFKSNDFLRHNTILFVGSMAAALVNYLYYPVLGRLLNTTHFGEVQALVSVFLQVGLFFAVIADVSVNIVANEKDDQVRNRTVLELERFTTLAMAAIVVIALCLSAELKSFLHFGSAVPFVVLGVSLVISASLSLRSAFLRGRKAFGRMSVAALLTAIVKLLLSAVFVLAGWGTSGALLGLVLAQIVSYVYTARQARRLGLSTVSSDKWWRLPDFSLLKPQAGYVLLVLAEDVATTVLFSIDSVVMKHYFSPHIAGLYAGIATIARIIYFLTGSIAIVLLSSVHLHEPAAKNRKVLLHSIAIQLAISGAALLVFALLPQFVVHVLLGSRYLPFASLLPKLSLTIFVMGMVNLIFSYDIALRRVSVGVLSVIGAGLTFAAIVVNHATPGDVVNDLLCGSALMLVLRGGHSIYRNFWQSKTTQA